MSEDKEQSEKEQPKSKKQEEQESSKEALKAGTKTAANAYAGPIGGKAVDLASKTKLGNAVLDKGAKNLNKKMPGVGKLANNANKAGYLNSLNNPRGNSDLITRNKELSAKEKASSNTTSTSNNINTNASSNSTNINKQDNKNNSNKTEKNSTKTNNQSNQTDSGRGRFSNTPFGSLGKDKSDASGGLKGGVTTTGNNSLISSFLKKYWYLIAAGFGLILILVILILAVPIIVGSVGGGVVEFFDRIGDGLIGFFKDDEFDAEQAINDYYEELEKVKSSIHNKKGVCIDENLITATLTVDIDAYDYAEQGEEPPDIQDENEYSEIVDTYKEMKKQVGLLANMQMKIKVYGNDKELNYKGGHCKPEHTGDEEELVDEENQGRLLLTIEDKIKASLRNGVVSDSAAIVSTHDIIGFFAFFTKKVNEEKNYEYNIWKPEAVMECSNEDENGNCIGTEVPVCHDAIPEDEYELSIGELNTMEQYVYYWNLVNSFIPEYYSEYLPDDEELKEAKIKQIAEDIYLLYKDLGTGETCGTSSPMYICRTDEGGSYYDGTKGDSSVPINASRQAFFDSIADLAISEMNRSGISASITMAQAALESANGGSGLSTKYSNYYGMTAGNCTSGLGSPSRHKGEVYQPNEGGNTCTGNAYWNGTVVAMCNSKGVDCQWYRVYDSFENSTKDHSRLLTNSNYNCNSVSGVRQQLECIKSGGYASDKDYVQKVLNIINSYSLNQYDIGVWDGILEEDTTIAYTNNLCYHYVGGEYGEYGDWANWKQANSPWSDLKIGTKTIGQVGCLMTSVAIQIARSGVLTTLGSDFNPGTFMQAHKANGGFDGNSFNWDVTSIAPNFKYHGKVSANNSNASSQIANYINQGYYVILNLQHPGEHHVAVDRVEGNNIYMFDPGNYGNEVFSASWGGKLTINSFSLYKVE